jgi:hypothetical protein
MPRSLLILESLIKQGPAYLGSRRNRTLDLSLLDRLTWATHNRINRWRY